MGFEPLTMTGNYYNDLKARFRLDGSVLTEMSAPNILYDEDADGTFFQFYGKHFPGGLFFEIIQRVGAYDGYGAPNAPFRTAAQKPLLNPQTTPSLKMATAGSIRASCDSDK